MTLAASAYIGGTRYTASPAGSSHTLSPTIHASQSHGTGVTVGVGVLSHVQSPVTSKLFTVTPVTSTDHSVLGDDVDTEKYTANSPDEFGCTYVSTSDAVP